MTRQLIGGLLVAGCALAAFAKSVPVQDPRSLPMSFELRREGPAEACGTRCRTWISAVGSITSDTPRHLETFIQSHDVQGATLALNSGGGSVLATMEMGRLIRRLEMVTTVGRTIALPGGGDEGGRRARLSPRADCEVDVRLPAARWR